MKPKKVTWQQLDRIALDWIESMALEYCSRCDSYDCSHRCEGTRNNAKAVLVHDNTVHIVTSENKLLIFYTKGTK